MLGLKLPRASAILLQIQNGAFDYIKPINIDNKLNVGLKLSLVRHIASNFK